MNPRIIGRGVAIALVALAGCQKQAPVAPPKPPAPKPLAVAVVKPSERSRNFLAVSRHLELGGTLYGYMDIDGDVVKLTSGLHQFLANIAQVQPAVAPFARQDYAAIATTLGLADIRAMGVSSVPDGTGYFRNRMFFYAPGQRHGLMLGLGGPPGSFRHLNLAPSDTAFYTEAEIDLPVVYRTIKDVVTQVAGEPAGNGMDAALKNVGQKIALSVLDLIHGLKGHVAVVLRVDPKEVFRLPGSPGIAVPAFSLLACVDGAAPAVEPALAQSPAFKRSDAGALHVFTLAMPLPIQGITPVFITDGTTLYFATTRGFFDACRALKSGLAQTPEFQRAVAGVGLTGNQISYVDPNRLAVFRKLAELNPQLQPKERSMITSALANVPAGGRPMVELRTNLPDGILVQSYWNRSYKKEVVLAAAYNPVTIGLVAAMAIPAFQKVRAASQQKAVLNNLRQLSSAADQYYLEHGVDRVAYDELVGPGKYIRTMRPVAGEDYRHLQFVKGQPLRIRMSNGKVIQYGP